MKTSDVIEAIEKAASQWIDVEYGPRIVAMEKSLSAPNRFTSEAMHFAINQQMHQLTGKKISEWWADRPCIDSKTIAVLNPGNIPLAGLQDLLAVIIAGHQYRGSLSSKSPYLLRAFAEEVMQIEPDLAIEFVDRSELLDGADKFIVTGNSQALEWAAMKSESVFAHSRHFGSPVRVRYYRGTRWPTDAAKCARP